MFIQKFVLRYSSLHHNPQQPSQPGSWHWQDMTFYQPWLDSSSFTCTHLCVSVCMRVWGVLRFVYLPTQSSCKIVPSPQGCLTLSFHSHAHHLPICWVWVAERRKMSSSTGWKALNHRAYWCCYWSGVGMGQRAGVSGCHCYCQEARREWVAPFFYLYWCLPGTAIGLTPPPLWPKRTGFSCACVCVHVFSYSYWNSGLQPSLGLNQGHMRD